MADQSKSGDGAQPRLAIELERRLVAASARHAASMDALQVAVSDYFDNLRAVGLTRDDAIAALREFVMNVQSRSNEADARRGDATGAGPRVVDDAMMRRIVKWCMDRAR